MKEQDLQSNFDKLVSQYMTLKKQVFEDIMTDKGQRDKYHNYYGKSVYYDGAYWYINNYGTAHKYTPGGKSWDDKSKSCPQNISGSIDLSDFQKGNDMVALQACGVSGNNIMNESSGEVAWVDVNGNKHVYSVDAYNNRPLVCKKEPKLLSSDEYNAIPEGPPMTKNDYCFTANINKDDYEKLLNLNTQILETAKKMLRQTSLLENRDEKQQHKVENKRKQLIQKIKQLEEEEDSINTKIDKFNSIARESDDYTLKHNMYSTTILMYSLSSILLGYMAFKLL